MFVVYKTDNVHDGGWSASPTDYSYGTYEQASGHGLAIDPVDLILPQRTMQYIEDAEIAWVEGFEMFRGKPIWVPAAKRSTRTIRTAISSCSGTTPTG